MYKILLYTICNTFRFCKHHVLRIELPMQSEAQVREQGTVCALPCLCQSSGWFLGRAALSAVLVSSPGNRPAEWGGLHTRPLTTEAKTRSEQCWGREMFNNITEHEARHWVCVWDSNSRDLGLLSLDYQGLGMLGVQPVSGETKKDRWEGRARCAQ